MKIMTIRTVLCCCLCLVLGACNKKDLLVKQRRDGGVRSMGDFIRNNYDLSLLAAALEKVNLLDSLDMPGPFTIMAPDNQAFGLIGITKPGDFDRMNMDSLRFMLKYHILPLRLYTSDMPAQLDSRFATLAGRDAFLSVLLQTPAYYSTIAVNGVLVKRTPLRDQALTNGALHVVDRVLKYYPGTIQGYLASNPDLSLFVAAMKRFQGWDRLAEEGPYTVYAPVNDAFLKYGLTADSISRMDPQDYDPVLFAIYPLMFTKRHLFTSDQAMITGDGKVVTISEKYTLSPEDNRVFIYENTSEWGITGPGEIPYAGGSARGTDLTVDNGIVHVMSDLFLYPDSLRKK